MEIINLQGSRANDTRQGIEKRQKNLMTQVQSFTNWVMGFEPIDFMNAADASAIRQVDNFDEPTFKEFQSTVIKDFSVQNARSSS